MQSTTNRETEINRKQKKSRKGLRAGCDVPCWSHGLQTKQLYYTIGFELRSYCVCATEMPKVMAVFSSGFGWLLVFLFIYIERGSG